MTTEFVVALEARPGTLAEVLRGLKDKNVDVRGVSGQNVGEFDLLHLVVDKPDECEASLRDVGVRFRMFDVITRIVPDRPGGLLEAAEKLGKSGINIEGFLPMRETKDGIEVAFRVMDAASARKALEG